MHLFLERGFQSHVRMAAAAGTTSTPGGGVMTDSPARTTSREGGGRFTPSSLAPTPSIHSAYEFAVVISDVIIDTVKEGKPIVYYSLEVVATSSDDGEEIVWTVSRRYSDFVKLKTELVLCGFAQLPVLPPKTWFTDPLDKVLIAKRKAALSSFMNALILDENLFKTRLVRYFLKTSEFFKRKTGGSVRNQPGSIIAARRSRLGENISLIPSPSATPTVEGAGAVGLMTVEFDDGVGPLEARWGRFLPLPEEGAPAGAVLTLSNGLAIRIDLPADLEDSGMNSEEDWVWIDASMENNSAERGRAGRVRVAFERRAGLEDSSAQKNKFVLSLPVFVAVCVILPLLYAYMMLYRGYTSPMAISVALILVLAVLCATPKSSTKKKAAAAPTAFSIAILEFIDESAPLPQGANISSSVVGRSKRQISFMNHSGAWVTDPNLSKTTMEPMMEALGIPWALRKIAVAMSTETKMEHTLYHIHRREYMGGGGKAIGKDEEDRTYPLDGKTYYLRDEEKKEDIFITHSFIPEKSLIISDTFNKTKKIRLVDHQSLLRGGKWLRQVIKTYVEGKDPVTCDVIKVRQGRPVRGAFENIEERLEAGNQFETPKGMRLATSTEVAHIPKEGVSD